MCLVSKPKIKKTDPVSPVEAPAPIETTDKVADAERPSTAEKRRRGRSSLRIERRTSSVATNVASPGSGVSV